MKPLTLFRSLPYFAIPSALMGLALFVTIPLADAHGVPLLFNVIGHVSAVLGGLGVAAIILAAREVRPGENIWHRLRLKPVRLSDILLGVIIGGAGLYAYLEMAPVMRWVLDFWPWSYPEWMVRFRTETHLLDVPMAGAWWLLGAYLLLYFCNVGGEELWWRGYIQPRQELAAGWWTWLPHGLMWAAFHAFFAWDILLLVPIGLMIAAACQWRRSAWPGMIAHAVLNGFGVMMIAGAIAAA